MLNIYRESKAILVFKSKGVCFISEVFVHIARQTKSAVILKAKRPILIQGYVWKWKIPNDSRTADVGILKQRRDRVGCARLMTENQTVKAHALSAWFVQLPLPYPYLPRGGRDVSHPWD